MANMIDSFFSNALGSDDIFQGLWISGDRDYRKHLNQYLVIHITFNDLPRKSGLAFLRNLLKDWPYVRMAYMTGILPIPKYSGGSELNMFAEYTMATEETFAEYFGFTEKETDGLYERYQKGSGLSGKIARDGLHTK